MISPLLLGAFAAILALLVLAYCSRQRLRWSRAVVELREVSTSLEKQPYGTSGHRLLHAAFYGVISALGELSKRRPAARWVLNEIQPLVGQYHNRAIVGSTGAWREIRDAFLERRRHPVRLVRAAAGWVVLVGLAGTVLGFMEALPALREVLASQDEVIQTAPPLTGEPASVAVGGTAALGEPDADERATLTGQKLYRVLDSLQGVFFATFLGVICAFALSGYNLVVLEPAFDRFADSVDTFGARWFEPLIQAPDNLVDDALRGELRAYFDEIGKGLEAELSPIVSQLGKSLEQMSGLATDFSGNIRVGASTLLTFHGAVEKLGGSAQDAVEQLVQIVQTSGDFVREVESLQQKGLEKLAGVLSRPTETLARAAAALDSRVKQLEGQITSLGGSSQAIVDALGQHSEGETALRENLLSTIKELQNQGSALSLLARSLGTNAKNLQSELASLFEHLVETQARSANENRSIAEQVSVGVEAIRGILSSQQALTTAGRSQEEGHSLKGLAKAIEGLSQQLSQPTASRAQPAARNDSDEQVRILKEIQVLLRRIADERPARLTVSREPRIYPQLEPEPVFTPDSNGVFSRVLRWLWSPLRKRP